MEAAADAVMPRPTQAVDSGDIADVLMVTLRLEPSTATQHSLPRHARLCRPATSVASSSYPLLALGSSLTPCGTAQATLRLEHSRACHARPSHPGHLCRALS